jgi:putative membrane protein
MSSTALLFTAWKWNPLAIAGALIALFVYFAHFGWNRRAWAAIAACAIFVAALSSPLAALADGYLFSAHMLQHMLLLLVVPALLLMALPETAVLPAWASRLLNPVACWAAGIGAMWIWHAPALCNAAATSPLVFGVQTISLVALGTAFWWQVLAPAPSQRIAPLRGAVYLFASCIACTILGIILTFSPVTVCSAYLNPADRLGIDSLIHESWGMTPLRDQQIGGLIMWVPMCLVYLCAIFGQLARWYAVPSQPQPAIS